jgi:hypothetical protein
MQAEWFGLATGIQLLIDLLGVACIIMHLPVSIV